VSKAGVEKVLNAMADESFRQKVKDNPEAALASYDLTPEEKAAIKSGNTAKLRELGVDERITKSALADIGGPGSEGGARGR
jgi:restriction endonuclease Mrr